MRKSLFIITPILIILANISCGLVGQTEPEIHTINLHQDTSGFAIPDPLEINPGDLVVFHSEKGRFLIRIKHADEFFVTESSFIQFTLNDGETSSALRSRSGLDAYDRIEYDIVCLTTGVGIEAPPRIIVKPQH